MVISKSRILMKDKKILNCGIFEKYFYFQLRNIFNIIFQLEVFNLMFFMD